MRSNSLAFIFVLGVAAVLRVLRMHVRWDEITLAYAAYAEPLTIAMADGHPTALIGHWIGLHPPLWGVIHAAFELVAPVPWVWMGFSAACSLGAVWIVGRHAGWIAALVLATAPVHLLDAAEVNNYPLAALAMAILIATARGPWLGLAVAAVFAAWAHLLTLVAAGAVVIWRALSLRAEERTRLLGAFTLGVLPIVGGALRLMGKGSTWAQPDVPFEAWLELVATTIGPEGLLLAPLVVLGLRGADRVAWVSLVGALLLSVGLDAAAAHQRPYLGIVAPAAAVAIGRIAGRHRWLMVSVAVICTVRGARFAEADAERFNRVLDDLSVTRGIDVALDETDHGDTVWLVSPALQTDDDKTASSGVFWRMRPWLSTPIARPVSFEYKDYRYGHPRGFDGRTIHTSTELYEEPFDHIARETLSRDQRLLVVIYDHSPATGLVDRIERVLQPYAVAWQDVGSDRGLGRDKVAIVTGLK